MQMPAPSRTRSRALALTLACAALASPAVPAVAASPEGTREETRLVSVNGQGEVRAQPDFATVTLGVSTRQPTLDAARQAANQVVDALLKVTRELRIPEARVRSTRINASPEYTWNEPRRERQLLGYAVQRQLVVDLRDLDKLGPLMEKSVSAGANLLQEPVLDSTQRKDLERQALALAVEDARRNADVLARAVGMSVGGARNVSGNGATQQPPGPVAMLAMARRDTQMEAPQTYQTGELVFAATASVTYDLVAAPK